MENNIPTTEEFLKNKGLDTENYVIYDISNSYLLQIPISTWLVEFAKLHVEAALKAGLDDIPCLGSSTDIASYEEVEEAVLNAYPLTNIK